MDKTEKLALARKKLRKFQAKTSSPLTMANPSSEINGLHDHTFHHFMDHSPKIKRTDDRISLSTPQINSQSLVSEKANLMNRLTQTETELRQKQQECFMYQNEISGLQRRVDQMNREREQLVTELERKTKIMSNSTVNDKELRGDLNSTKRTLDDLTHENNELLTRLAIQTKELLHLSQTNTDLQSNLSMKDTLLHQLQSSSSRPTTPTIDNEEFDKIDELEGEVSRLMANLQSVKRERDQTVSDVSALREALLASQQENARKVGDLQTLVKESEIEITTLTEQLSSNSVSTDLKDREVISVHQSLDVISRERDDLKIRIQQLVLDNGQLHHLYSTTEESLNKLERELSRVKGEVVNQQSLMATISQDKESISRAVAQNKDLKEQLAELQEAFVQKSHQNMELATALESEKYQNEKLSQKQSNVERELVEEKVRNEEMTRELSIVVDKGEESRTVEPMRVTHDDIPSTNTTQLQELSLEERDKLLEELRCLSSPSPSIAMEQGDDDSNNSILQQSFSALQERFTSIMRDKADLLDRLQVMEHTIIQLSGENETIAEYVTLYQTQREALKIKFSEKDKIIEQLQQEKNSLQLKLREVQLMLSRLDHTPSGYHHDDHPPNIHNSNNHHHHSSLPAHVSTEKGVVNQIVSLIEEELTYPSSSNGLSTTTQCPCCSGQLIVI